MLMIGGVRMRGWPSRAVRARVCEENLDPPAERLPASAVVHQGIGVLVALGGLTSREAEVALHDVAARAGRTPLAVARLLLEGARRGTADLLMGDALRAALDERLAAALSDRTRFGAGDR